MAEASEDFATAGYRHLWRTGAWELSVECASSALAVRSGTLAVDYKSDKDGSPNGEDRTCSRRAVGALPSFAPWLSP
jgi:hypothetical protein